MKDGEIILKKNVQPLEIEDAKKMEKKKDKLKKDFMACEEEEGYLVLKN